MVYWSESAVFDVVPPVGRWPPAMSRSFSSDTLITAFAVIVKSLIFSFVVFFIDLPLPRQDGPGVMVMTAAVDDILDIQITADYRRSSRHVA
jgi:hypothetical protein